MKKIAYLIIIASVVMFASTVTPLRAEETSASGDAVLSQVEQLEALRQFNPEAYRQWVENKKASLRQQFQQMNGDRRAQFGQFVQGQKNRRIERLRQFRQRRPEAYQRFMNHRMQRWQNRAQKNPQQYQNFLNTHPGIKEKLENNKSRREGFQKRRPGNQDAGAAGPRMRNAAPQPERSGRPGGGFRAKNARGGRRR